VGSPRGGDPPKPTLRAAPDDDRSVRRIVDLDARGGKSIQRRKSDVATI